MADDGRIELRISGEKAGDAKATAELLSNLDDLFKTVAEAMGEDPEAVSLKVGRMRWVCDGCGCERPEDYADWTKRDGLDFCPACSTKQEEGRGD